MAFCKSCGLSCERYTGPEGGSIAATGSGLELGSGLGPGLEVDVVFRTSIPSAERSALLMQTCALLYTPDREHFGIVPIEVRERQRKRQVPQLYIRMLGRFYCRSIACYGVV
jgi:hypothetical protein